MCCFSLYVVATRMESDEQSNSVLSIRGLGSAFNWEIRVLYLGIVAGPVYIFNPVVGWAMFFAVFVLVAFTDLMFSIVATRLFLRPILETLRPMEGVLTESEGYLHMQRTKWLTLIGSSLAVLSSTILCMASKVGIDSSFFCFYFQAS